MPSSDISRPAHNYPSPSHLSSETPNLRSSFALSRQIQDLEQEIGFRLFDRLPRGVKMSEAGNLFLNDARRILQEVNDAAARAKRVACGLAGTLRIGFVESISWHGIIPDSIRDFRERRPDAEVQLIALSSLEQIAAIQSGSLDAGYAVPLVNPDHGLAHFQVGIIKTILAVPKGHAVAKRKKIRLRDLVDLPFVRFPQWAIPNVYERLMAACVRGGLEAPRVVQETALETTILSLVQCRVCIAFVNSAAQWRCPPGVVLLPVIDLNVQFPFALMWRKDNHSPLLAKFTDDVRLMVERKSRKSKIFIL